MIQSLKCHSIEKFDCLTIGGISGCILKWLLFSDSKVFKIISDILKTKSNLNKVKKLIGYSPKVPLADGIKKFSNWYKKHV